jgi:hypothetical protein
MPQLSPKELLEMTHYNPKSYDDDDDKGGAPAEGGEHKD